MIGRYAQADDGECVCRDCGAVVRIMAVHDRFHAAVGTDDDASARDDSGVLTMPGPRCPSTTAGPSPGQQIQCELVEGHPGRHRNQTMPWT
jgi:hypothetical protein